MPLNITVCNGKGGVGKTTVSVLLASTLAKQGRYRVGFIDHDGQQGAAEWIAEDPALGFPLLSGAHDLPDLDVVLVDTPPFPAPKTPDDDDPKVLAAVAQMTPIFQAADLIVVVASPSPHDLKSTVATTALIHRILGDGARACVLYNQVNPRTILGRNIATKHDDKLSIPALAATLSDRQIYQHVRTLGVAALDSASRSELLVAALELMRLRG